MTSAFSLSNDLIQWLKSQPRSSTRVILWKTTREVYQWIITLSLLMEIVSPHVTVFIEDWWALHTYSPLFDQHDVSMTSFFSSCLPAIHSQTTVSNFDQRFLRSWHLKWEGSMLSLRRQSHANHSFCTCSTISYFRTLSLHRIAPVVIPIDDAWSASSGRQIIPFLSFYFC